MKTTLKLKLTLGLLFTLNLHSTIINHQSFNLYAQDPELFENNWYLEKVIIDNNSYYITDYTEYIATIEFFEIDEEIQVLLCEFDTFQSDINFLNNNGFEIFEIELNPFFGDCVFVDGDFLFFQDAYFSIFLENFSIPKNPFTYSIESVEGHFQLTIENVEGDWAVYNSVLLSSQEFNQNNFTIYPNPVKETLNINNGSNQQVTATVYDIDGKLLQSHSLENNLSTLDVKALSQGLYFVVFENENGERVSKKFIKY